MVIGRQREEEERRIGNECIVLARKLFVHVE